MIKEALEYLVSVGNTIRKEDKVTVADREFLREPNNWREILPDVQIARAFLDEQCKPLRLGTIEALIEFVKAHADKKCQILVSPRGCKAYFGIDESVNLTNHMNTLLMVTVPFLPVPKKLEMGFIKFQDWLDQHADMIKEHADLAKAVKLFKTEERNSVTVKESGPIITLSVAASKDCEGSGLPIPKEIDVILLTGTREFLIENIFLLRITIDRGEVVFTLTKKEQDGSWEKLVEQAFAKLQGAGLTNALILEGAEDVC